MSTPNENVRQIARREAKSGNVSYGDGVVLHDTSKRRVVLIPFFIHHSDHNELAIKITTYLKKAPPLEWPILEEKSLSLDEAATRRLLGGLRDHLAVAKEDSDGNYILIRVLEGTAQIGEHDPAAVASALTKVLSSQEILEHLTDTDLSEELVKAFRGAIRLKEMQTAVSQLRDYLERGETSEEVYQRWCETHSWAFGSAYVMRDEVREISPGDHLDILLSTVISGYRDIVELKRPNMRVLLYDEDHRSYYFAADVSRALGQCHRYLDVLQEVAAKGLLDHPEIVAYHPRAIIVIGRSNDWSNEQLRALHGLNRRLSSATVMTYDQLLAQGEHLIELLSSKLPDKAEEALPELENLNDDDIPW